MKLRERECERRTSLFQNKLFSLSASLHRNFFHVNPLSLSYSFLSLFISLPLSLLLFLTLCLSIYLFLSLSQLFSCQSSLSYFLTTSSSEVFLSTLSTTLFLLVDCFLYTFLSFQFPHIFAFLYFDLIELFCYQCDQKMLV